MSQATIVFNDPRQLYAGTAKFDGSLEERKKFKEDFEKVCKKVNPLAYFITQRVIPIRKIPGDKYGGHEWDRDAHIQLWERVKHLSQEIRWSRSRTREAKVVQVPECNWKFATFSPVDKARH